MAKYKMDLRDIRFNLFETLKVQNLSYGLGEQELTEIVNEFDKFCEKEVFAHREEAESVGVELKDGKVIVPKCFHGPKKSFYENGWFALGVEEEFGGMPVPHAVATFADSHCAASNVSFSMYHGLSKGVFNNIKILGSSEQKEKYLPKMMEGAWGGTMCLTEPGAGSDVGASTTTATPDKDGKYKIKGVKIFISSGDNDLYENIIHLVLAKTPNAPEGSKGLSLFIVPKSHINDDGSTGKSNDVACHKIEAKMGLHSGATCELTFGEKGECYGEMIGEEFKGMSNMFLLMNEARLLTGLQGESQANLSYELTKQYAYERSQFKTEIVNHPDVKRMLLKMRAMGRGLRALSLYTANLIDLEKTNPDISKELALFTPICKSYGSEEGFNVIIDAIQVHGGYGYCKEYGVEQFARDAKIATIYEGTNGIQAIDLVMRKILKDQGQTLGQVVEKISRTLGDPRASQFPNEVGLIGKNLQKGEAILKHFGALAQEGKTDTILESCSDFLNYLGNIIVSWLLFDHALDASSKLDSASGEEKDYYESKIVDFKIFCRHQLTKNSGISQNILNFSDDLANIVV